MNEGGPKDDLALRAIQKHQLRKAACWALVKMGISDGYNPITLSRLFGVENYVLLDELQCIDPTVDTSLKALAGVYGRAVYELLLIKRGYK